MSGHAMVSFIKRSDNLQNIALFTALCIAVVIAAATPTPWAGKLAPQGVDKLFHTAGFAVLLMHMLMVRLKSGLVMAPLALVFLQRYRTHPTLCKPVWRFLRILAGSYGCSNRCYFGNTLQPIYKRMREA